jgi:hypothetical protein
MIFKVLSIGLLALPWPGVAARAGELQNGRAVLARAEPVSGGTVQNLRIRIAAAIGPACVAAQAPQTGAIALYPGPRAPFCDRAGLLTAGRVAGMVIGLTPVLDAIAADLAGNGDGRIDAADAVALVNRMIP